MAIVAAIFTFSVVTQAEVIVTKTADTNDGLCNADCSLREAIAAAPPGDTVSFSGVLFSTPQTLTLTLGELVITKNLIIIGRPLTVTISGNNASRVFLIGGAAGTTVSMSSLTVANGTVGASGAGILVNSGVTVNLTRITVRSNTGTAGGGIFNAGTLNITQSTISGNHATLQSGGLQNGGAATIINSTFSGNTSANNGGAIIDFGQTNLINTTISRNTGNVAGGFLKAGGAAANIRNTIIAANVSANGDSRNDVTGPFASQGNNLIGNAFGSTGFTNGISGDIVGTTSTPVNPLLGPLTNNSGENDTLAPIYPSPVLNAGNNCVTNASCGPVNNPPTSLTLDQRGLSRSDGTGVDIGAMESSYLTVVSTADTGPGSLRLMMSVGRGAIITIAPNDGGCSDGVCTINLTSGALLVGGTISILGSGARSTIIRRSTAVGTSHFRIFLFPGNGGGSINGVSIRNGRTTSNGGGINVANGAEVYLNGVELRDNFGGSGGGVYNAGLLSVADSVISSNTATLVGSSPGGFHFGGLPNGGGIITHGKLNVRNSTISSNTSMDSGGGIYVGADGEAFLNNVTLANNSAMSGGGVYGNSEGVTELRNTLVALNTATLGPDLTGLVTSRRNNLVRLNNGDAASGFPAGNPNSNGDRVGTSASPMEPLLGPLANNGGQTDTFRLLSLSPAVNTGNNCVVNRNCPNNNPPVALTYDQRGPGFGRQQLGNVDIGAFEAGNDAPFDFDGDGKTDIGIFRPAPGEWWINRSSTGVTFALQFGASTDRIVPADYTGDGKADVAFFRPSTGEWYVLRSENLSFFSFPFGLNGDIPAPADYDGDGKADPAVFRPSSATWFIRRSSDSTTVIQAFGANGDQPVPADYDGDGRADIAIYRPSNGQWWLNRSTAGVIAMTFGNASDKVLQGDYTGDGKADVAFWRPSTGEWYILRSENLSYYSVPFGLSTDVPAPGDFDGDGKFDIAVFRPSAATWYVQRSTAGTLIQQFGSGGDRPLPNAFIP